MLFNVREGSGWHRVNKFFIDTTAGGDSHFEDLLKWMSPFVNKVVSALVCIDPFFIHFIWTKRPPAINGLKYDSPGLSNKSCSTQLSMKF